MRMPSRLNTARPCELIFIGVLALLPTWPAPSAPEPPKPKAQPVAPASEFLGELRAAEKAMAEGLPEVAALKANRVLDTPGVREVLGKKDRLHALELAVEGWVRSRNVRHARRLTELPELPNRAYWRGQALILAGSLDEAEDELKRYPPDGPLAEQARLSLAHVYLAEGREAAARREVKELRESSDPDIARHARMLFNELELVVGRNQVVVDRLVREKSPGSDGPVKFLQARGQFQLGNRKKAEEILRNLVGQPAVGERVHNAAAVLLADVLLRDRRHLEARDLLMSFIDTTRDTAFWNEAFSLLDEALRGSEDTQALPPKLVGWVADGSTPARQGQAMFLVAQWLNRAGRKEEAVGLMEALIMAHPGEDRESDAMRAAMEIYGSVGADGRVLALARMWKEKFGGGGESLVDFITGAILFGRGDFSDSLVSFERSADLASSLAERRRALFNAGVSAFLAGNAEVYQRVLEQLRVVGAAPVDVSTTVPAGEMRAGSGDKVPIGESAADLELDRALHLAARQDPGAELELQRLSREMPDHPRWPEVQVALAELSLLDVPPRTKAAEAALELIDKRNDVSVAIRQRVVYTRMWLKEAEGDLKAVTVLGSQYLKDWPDAPMAPEVQMKVAEAYFRQEDYANARTQFELLAASHADSPYADVAQFFAAKAALAVGSEEGINHAIELWEDIVESGGPLAIVARQQQARAKRQQGKESEALALVDSLLDNPAVDPDMRRSLMVEKAELLLLLGKTEPRQMDSAIELLRGFLKQEDLPYRWRARTGKLLADILKLQGKSSEALEACYDVVERGSNYATRPSNPTDFLWYYRAGFMAVELLEESKQWEAAARMAERLAASGGDRSEEARKRATDIRLEHFIWDAK